MKIVLVSGFFNIGRENFKNSSRSVERYLNSFKNYYNYDYRMIVFMDERYASEFINKDKYKRIVPINREWLMNNILSYQQLNRATEIMNSEEYKKLVKERIENGNPENIYPEYNIINHSKIDFINYAINQNWLNEEDFVCWSDFGYFDSILHNNPSEYPKSVLDLRKFKVDKLNFFLRNEVKPEDNDIIRTLKEAREVFTGSFWGGPVNRMKELYNMYHNCLNELYEMGISDDDQHIYLRCYLSNPEMFEIYVSSEWPQALRKMEYKIENRLEYINRYLSEFKNGKFAEIGVCHGVLSESILSNNMDCKLYCVDPYISYSEYEDSCNNEVGDKLHNEVKKRLHDKFGDRVKFVRKYSVEGAKEVESDLDFVYIDGNHKYSYVMDDLRSWYPKVKESGIIIMDDVVDELDMPRDENGDVFIQWNGWSSGKYGVLLAVKNFTEEKNIRYYRFQNQVLIRK